MEETEVQRIVDGFPRMGVELVHSMLSCQAVAFIPAPSDVNVCAGVQMTPYLRHSKPFHLVW